ncbi:hypothetical protein AURDEDRAFT_117771 [Auricularia subglabra TFB-10046 SS5]|uniref:Uncharacterized protein n=1 Tax=Auricularia subglabra (strain TFB-10046 / SS5) TaxID=717982 RepID=J0D5R4_AURST|nr:hypothetical protein AURDEDRAFT_117771 [Auricularia subglabra TFB-10046 SS5]
MFGALDCDGTSFIAFQERGEGLDAVVQVIRTNVDDSSDEYNLQMKSWAAHQHQAPVIEASSKAQGPPGYASWDDCKRRIESGDPEGASKRQRKADDVVDLSSEDEVDDSEVELLEGPPGLPEVTVRFAFTHCDKC